MKQNNQLKKEMENKGLLILKMAIASALSWEIAKLLGSHHPYLAPISVILCLQTTVNRSIRFSYHRMVGTVIGIVVVVLLSSHLKVSGGTIGLFILIGCFIAKWLKRDETAIHQVALTVLLVFTVGNNSGNYHIDRFRDTLIGAMVAVILHMLVYPPNYTKQAAKSLQQYSERLLTTINQISEWIRNGLDQKEGQDLRIKTKQLLEDLHRTKNLMKDAEDSLKYNFFAKKSGKELKSFQKKMYYYTQGYSYLSNTVDTLQEWSTTGTITPNHKTVWADQIKALAPFFQIYENLESQSPPQQTLKITIPVELEKLQFHLSLYHETKSLLKKLEELPS